MHAAITLKSELRRRFGQDGVIPHNCPLFPDQQGNWCTRAGFVGTLKALANLVGIQQLDLLDRDIIGEHCWRVTGARHLASLDVPLPIIMLLGRWGSNVVMRYVADAPLSTLTEICLQRVKDAAPSTLRAALGTQQTAPPTTHLQQQLNDPNTPPSSLPHTLPALQPTTTADTQSDDERQEAEAGCPFIYAAKQDSFHLAGTWTAFSQPQTWKSPCGFHYGCHEFLWISALQEGQQLCKQCRRYGKLPEALCQTPPPNL